MAVLFIRSRIDQEGLLICLSTDTKPTTHDGDTLKKGFRALETDTGRRFVFDGTATWTQVGDVNRTAITAILASTQLDDNPTSVNSDSLDVSLCREILCYLTMDSTLAPTTLQWIAQFSDDGGTTWYNFLQGIWAAMFFEDTEVASGVTYCFSCPAVGRLFRLRAVAVGSDATNFFTVAAKAEGRD